MLSRQEVNTMRHLANAQYWDRPAGGNTGRLFLAFGGPVCADRFSNCLYLYLCSCSSTHDTAHAHISPTLTLLLIPDFAHHSNGGPMGASVDNFGILMANHQRAKVLFQRVGSFIIILFFLMAL